MIVDVGPTPKQTEKSNTQIIVGIERMKEEMPSMIIEGMLDEKKYFWFKTERGKATTQLKKVVKKARARLTRQEKISEPKGMLERFLKLKNIATMF